MQRFPGTTEHREPHAQNEPYDIQAFLIYSGNMHQLVLYKHFHQCDLFYLLVNTPYTVGFPSYSSKYDTCRFTKWMF